MSNTHNNTYTTHNQVVNKFVPPDWTKMSTRQKMTYIRNEIRFVYGKIQKPDSDIAYWRKQLSYFLWIPVHNSLHVEEAKREGSRREEKISKSVSKFLFELVESIPEDREGALAALKQRYNRVTTMINAYDLRAVNTLRTNIGLEPEARDNGLELFNQIFAPEIKERAANRNAILA